MRMSNAVILVAAAAAIGFTFGAAWQRRSTSSFSGQPVEHDSREASPAVQLKSLEPSGQEASPRLLSLSQLPLVGDYDLLGQTKALPDDAKIERGDRVAVVGVSPHDLIYEGLNLKQLRNTGYKREDLTRLRGEVVGLSGANELEATWNRRYATESKWSPSLFDSYLVRLLDKHVSGLYCHVKRADMRMLTVSEAVRPTYSQLSPSELPPPHRTAQ